jgi:hypothetical protein
VSGLFPEPCTGDDLTFREVLTKTVNEILLRLEKGSLNAQDLETIGFALRRTWEIARAWKAERQGTTLAAWLEKLKDAASGAGVQI